MTEHYVVPDPPTYTQGGSYPPPPDYRDTQTALPTSVLVNLESALRHGLNHTECFLADKMACNLDSERRELLFIEEGFRQDIEEMQAALKALHEAMGNP